MILARTLFYVGASVAGLAVVAGFALGGDAHLNGTAPGAVIYTLVIGGGVTTAIGLLAAIRELWRAP